MSKQEISDAEIVEETPKGSLRVAVIGEEDNALTRATLLSFGVPKGVDAQRYSVDDIDKCVESTPNVVFWCEPIDVKKNDSLDDSDLLASIQKLVRVSRSGICLRSVINIETHDRLVMSLTKEGFDAKVVYMPDMSDSQNVSDIIDASLIMGGSQQAISALVGILSGASWFNTLDLVTGTAAEVVYTRLVVSGYNMVRQKYFDEVHEAVLDMKGANPMVVNRLITKVLGDVPVPSSVNENVYDARIFAGATDKLTLIESCLEN
jgi:hypothetical protein